MKKQKIEDLGYPPAVVEIVSTIIKMIENGQSLEAERKIARLGLKLCADVELDKANSLMADQCFTLLSIYVGDNFPDFKFSKAIDSLIFEGMTLHDFGKSYGADIALMKKLAREFLA